MQKADAVILAVDLGTSGPKSGLISIDGRFIADAFSPLEVNFLPGGGAEQNPSAWMDAIFVTWKELKKKNPPAWKNITGISVTAQWSGIVAVDRNGNALTNGIIWLDSRGNAITAKKFRGIVNMEGYGIHHLLAWIRKTGGIASHSGKDSLSHILWLREYHPEIYDNTYKFLEVKDYINLKLTGEFRATYDSITLQWITDNRDIHNIHYDPALIRRLRLDPEKFPPLIHATDFIGNILPSFAREYGIPASARVTGGTPDMQSACLGSGSFRPDIGHIYIGTSSWISTHVPFKKTDLFHNIASLPSALPGHYFIAATQETAGAVFKHAMEQIFHHPDWNPPHDINPYKKMDAIAAKAPPGSKGVMFTPWMYGERAPVENSHLRATHWNLSLDTGIAEYIRSMLEGVALNQKWLLPYVEKFAGNTFTKIHFIGGGSHSEVFGQILSDVLNRPVHRVENGIRSNLMGAFFVARIAFYGKDTDLSSFVHVDKIFEPNPAHRNVYDDLSEKYIFLYKKSVQIYSQLNAGQ